MDKDVVQRGIEARYGTFFRQNPTIQKGELPIRGDTYLQKIVQIPFHLPALGVEDLVDFIEKADPKMPSLTRQVFAQGLFPNPRQTKRALNIFRLLQQIATVRQARGGLPSETIFDPLLAKTVLIQTQFPSVVPAVATIPDFDSHLRSGICSQTDQ